MREFQDSFSPEKFITDMSIPSKRRSLDETWAQLEADGMPMPRDAKGAPFIPASMPNHDDDEPLGFSYFRTALIDADLSHVTLPRTFFGRSSFEQVDFRNSDISQSRMCWNDFVECDFSGADLSGCDMRAAVYRKCRFVGANLQNADMRCSAYEDCDFTDAALENAISDSPSAEVHGLLDCLSVEQEESMMWHDDPGPEAPGG